MNKPLHQQGLEFIDITIDQLNDDVGYVVAEIMLRIWEAL